MRLAGKVAIVTGARAGLGKAIAEAYAKEGADVAVVSRKISEDDEVVKNIKAYGRRAFVGQADVGVRAQIVQLIDDVAKEFGKIDILVNNAGLTRPAMMLKMTPEQWGEVINIHLTGTFYCTQAAAQYMKDQNSGSIINLTSSAGLQGTIGQVNYAAAKGGINAFTMAAAKELAKYNVRVNAISPLAETEMTEKIATDEELSKKYLARVPMGRFGKPEEVAPCCVFLGSDESTYITGQIICIDGGMIMR
jgi:3-oxoacyl-[acyl-carrier protein] reductase